MTESYAQVPFRAFKLPSHLYKLFSYLCYRSNRNGLTFVGIAHLADFLGCGERNIQNHINDLVDQGYVKKIHRYFDVNTLDEKGRPKIKTAKPGEEIKGRQTTNFIKIVWDNDPEGLNLTNDDFDDAERKAKEENTHKYQKDNEVIHNVIHRGEVAVQGEGEVAVQGEDEVAVHPYIHNNTNHNQHYQKHFSKRGFKNFWNGEREVGQPGSVWESRYIQDMKEHIINAIESRIIYITEILGQYDVDDVFDCWITFWKKNNRNKIKNPAKAFYGFCLEFIKNRQVAYGK
jgi:DNA-binding Lrp family transcriptional regulator